MMRLPPLGSTDVVVPSPSITCNDGHVSQPCVANAVLALTRRAAAPAAHPGTTRSQAWCGRQLEIVIPGEAYAPRTSSLKLPIGAHCDRIAATLAP